MKINLRVGQLAKRIHVNNLAGETEAQTIVNNTFAVAYSAHLPLQLQETA